MDDDRFLGKPRNLGELVGETVQAMNEERKERCIHCGYEWYVGKFNDGRCRQCEAKGLPGRTEIARRKKQKRDMIAFFITAAIVLIALIVMS